MTEPVMIHATCVAIDGAGVLIEGGSGAGKSDLALRLIDRGARLVSDDATMLSRGEAGLLATAPGRIAGLIEVRGVGILSLPHIASVPVRLLIELDGDVERLPEMRFREIAGSDVPVVALAAFEPSAPIKVELALAQVMKRS